MNPSFSDQVCRAGLKAAVVLCLYAALLLVIVTWPLGVVIPAVATVLYVRRRRRLPASDEYGSARWLSDHEAENANLFFPTGLFLGRWAGPPPGRLQAAVRLFTLPTAHSAIAVRQFLDAFGNGSTT